MISNCKLCRINKRISIYSVVFISMHEAFRMQCGHRGVLLVTDMNSGGACYAFCYFVVETDKQKSFTALLN